MNQSKESFSQFTEAMHLYQSMQADASLVAEVHYHLAESLLARGDVDGAISHAQRCKKLRERAFGQQDHRTIEAYRQVAKFVLTPFGNYNGVMTPQIKSAYTEAINCYEKVFRYLKIYKGTDTAIGRPNQGSHSRSVSQCSLSTESRSVRRLKTQEQKLILPAITGPYFSAPYATPLLLSRNLLHKITREIVHLKLALVEHPKHKECVRMLRKTDHEHGISSEDARTVILRLAAVSPSVYLSGLLSRIEEDDEEAIEELAIVIRLTENETVGMN
jgi:hypothetical protein